MPAFIGRATSSPKCIFPDAEWLAHCFAVLICSLIIVFSLAARGHSVGMLLSL